MVSTTGWVDLRRTAKLAKGQQHRVAQQTTLHQVFKEAVYALSKLGPTSFL